MRDETLTETLTLIDEAKPLPEGWHLVRLGDVCQFVGGSQPPAHTFKRKPLPNYIRLVQIQDFRRDDFAVYIPEIEARRTFDETDVMIGRYGPPVFQILRGLSGAYNVALMKTVPDESQITKDYLYHLLKLDRVQNAVIAQSERSAGQSGVAKDFLENLIIPLPPIEEQRRIASILDEQMKAVEQARLAVEEQLKAANLLPNAFLRSVFESEEAEHWKKERFGNLVNNFDGQRIPLSQNERRDKKGTYPYYGASGIIDYLDEYIFDGEFLLIGEDGANLLSRSTPIAFKASGQFWVNNHAHVVKPKENITIDYLIHFFAATDLSPFVNGMAQPKLNQKDGSGLV